MRYSISYSHSSNCKSRLTQTTLLIAAERDASRQRVESGGTPLEQLAGLAERVRRVQRARAHSRALRSARAQPPAGARGPLPPARLRERCAPAAARTRLRAAHYLPRAPHSLDAPLVLRGIRQLISLELWPLDTRLVLYAHVSAASCRFLALRI